MKNIFELMRRTPEPDDEIVTAFRDGQVTLRNNRRCDGYTNAIQEEGYQRIHAGDLVIHVMDAFAGAIGVSDSDGKSTPVYSVCRPKSSDLDVYFYGRLLRHMALSGYLNALSKGIRERSTEFRWKEVANVVVAIPPHSEQLRITAFLDRETAKIDALVSEQRRLIELLTEKRQAVISHAVTKGLNSHAPMKPSGIDWLGDVPEHWEEVPLKSLFALKHGYAFDGNQFSDEGEYLLMTPGNFNERGGFRARDQEKFYAGTDIPPEFILQSGQMLLAMTEQAPGLLGSALFVPEGVAYLHNQRLGRVHGLQKDKVMEQFLFHLFNSRACY